MIIFTFEKIKFSTIHSLHFQLKAPIYGQKLNFTIFVNGTNRISEILTQWMTPGTQVFNDVSWLNDTKLWEEFNTTMTNELMKQDC